MIPPRPKPTPQVWHELPNPLSRMEAPSTSDESMHFSENAEQLMGRIGFIATQLLEVGMSEWEVSRPHPHLVLLRRGVHVLVVVPLALWLRERELLDPFRDCLSNGTALLLLWGRPDPFDLTDALTWGVAHLLSEDPTPLELRLTAVRAFELLEARHRTVALERSTQRYDYELSELLLIAQAMTNERDVEKLLSLILEKSRFITGADAGSIYVAEEDKGSAVLRFKLFQNDSISFDGSEFVVPITNRSIAGSAALKKQTIRIDNVYQISPDSAYAFDPSFDKKTGYFTKSLLVMPLISQVGEVIGVIQLINKKRDPRKELTPANVNHEVVAFDQRSEELLHMLAAHAGVSLEKAQLYEEIRLLFDGFVKASVEAIEQRDPTTSGHSRRVADLTVQLAILLDAESHGPYRNVVFNAQDLREIEYASLLHDFGKIGVRERVLIKAKKLFDEELELIQNRFHLAIRTLEAEILSRKLRAIEHHAHRDVLDALGRELIERREELDAAFKAVVHANEPTVLQAGDFAIIESIALDLPGKR